MEIIFHEKKYFNQFIIKFIRNDFSIKCISHYVHYKSILLYNHDTLYKHIIHIHLHMHAES